MQPSTANRPILKELKCPNCGSPIQQHVPDAQTLVCGNCGSYISVGAESPALLEKGGRFPGSPVPVKVGDRFKLDDVEYFVLGRVMYRGWDPEETSDTWVWDEWQLGASDGRMLWLSYDTEDGFVLYKKLRLREQFNPRTSMMLPVGDGRKAPVRERYPARIVGAEGELTFQAKRGDQVYMVEGASGGKKYSLQVTPEEIELYEGSRLQEAAIATSLGNQSWLDRINAREENNKTRDYIGAICLVFAMIALILAAVSSQTGKTIFDQVLTVNTQNPVATLPVEFDKAGHPAVVKARLQSDMPVNTYVDADVRVISPNEKETIIFSKEFYYETGSDDGGPWSEKKESVSDMFVPYQSGTHYIKLALGGTGFTGDMSVQVEVQKDRVVPGWFLGYGAITGLIGLVLVLQGGGVSPKILLIIAAPVVIILGLLAAGVDVGDMLDFAFDIMSEM